MQAAKPNRLVLAWFNRYCRYTLRKHFHAVRLYGPEAKLAVDPAQPNLFVANHSSFWDGILLNYLFAPDSSPALLHGRS